MPGLYEIRMPKNNTKVFVLHQFFFYDLLIIKGWHIIIYIMLQVYEHIV